MGTRTRTRRWRLAAALASAGGVALVAVLGAYGGSDHGAAVHRGVLPACAKVPRPAARPPTLPRNFPFPPGTAIRASAVPRRGELLLAGAVPGGLQSAATFLRSELAARGYAVQAGDAEPGEAEAPFSGRGVRGKWKLNEIVACRALELTLVLLRT